MSLSRLPPFPNQTTNGSIIFVLFASIGMVGLIGAAGMDLMRGPVRAMAEVTKRTIAENHMIASGKLALVMSTQQTGDCDDDGMIEPIEWADAGTKPKPLNGGLLPSNIGAALQDPWGNSYGYCAWDHGTLRGDDACGVGARRLYGSTVPSKLVIAIISPGPDKIFQTGCQSEGHGEYLLRIPGNDDVVLAYSFAEAMTLSGGLWNLKENDVETATIAKNLSVTDGAGDEQLSFDAVTKALSIGSGGTGEMPNIKTDYIQNLSANLPVEFLSDIKTGAANITTADANAVAAIITSSGAAGVGLKASGTSKAIESEGILDMTAHKIINLADPDDDQDAATKKYVDDKTKAEKRIKCEAFVFSGCSGGTQTNVDKSTLGDCKKACEEAGARCCHAQFATTANDPHAPLSKCVAHVNGGTSGALANLLLGLLFPANVGAYCYEQY